MIKELPEAGSAKPAMMLEVHAHWIDAARAAGIDLTDFNAVASFEERLAWARRHGLLVAAAYGRYSTKLQSSTSDQFKACVAYAAQHGMYVPPELLCCDEGVRGKRVQRDGLDRLNAIFDAKVVDVLLVFKMSRLFRLAYQGFKYIQEEVVDRGFRAISVSQQIDTNDEKSWRLQITVHGLIDDSFTEAVADHVREGLKGRFARGYVIGALPIGYRRKELPGEKTNRGSSKAIPEIDPEVGKLVRDHFEMVAQGVPLRETWRRWLTAKGPYDKRSSRPCMSLHSFRAMLLNEKYVGHWSHGRFRNKWVARKDGIERVAADAKDIVERRDEALRIVSDETFFQVQARLQQNRRHHRGQHKRSRPVQLHDLVTDVFHCAHCGARFYQVGTNGESMGCPIPRCPNSGTVLRQRGVALVCQKLQELILQDSAYVVEVIQAAQKQVANGDGDLQRQVAEAEQSVARLSKHIDYLMEAGEGESDEDRRESLTKLKAARQERTQNQVRLLELRRQRDQVQRTLSRQEIESILADLATTMECACNDTSAAETLYEAAELFRVLVDGKVSVSFEKRPHSTKANAMAAFIATIFKPVTQRAGVAEVCDQKANRVQMSLREPPLMDRYAEQVRDLYEQGQSFCKISRLLVIPNGTAASAYNRYYNSRGLPVPPRRTRSQRQAG